MVRVFAMQQQKPFDAVRTAGTVRWAASAFRFEAGARALVVVHCLDAPPVPLPEHSQLKRWLLNRRRASVQRLAAAAPVRRCTAPAERVDGTGTVYTTHPAPISRVKAHRFVSEPERQET
ncbi:MAG: hypothetical protein IAE80_00685 [Anaerolinea sp.]|nr:hypothetical protein [Anaerolinea sp.]